MARTPTRQCFCGCGKDLFGSRTYFPGHKPARVKKTHEEVSLSHKKVWEERKAADPEKYALPKLNPCVCGCGKMVNGRYSPGHKWRVENPSKLPHVKEMRRQNFYRMHAEGRLGEGWMKGLTIEDPRVAANMKGLMEIVKSPEHRQKMSDMMRQEWEDGTIVPLKGADHPNWKGGVSKIVDMRGSHQLYLRWRLPILIRDSFTCQMCQGRDDFNKRLAVHHDGERFADILRKFVPPNEDDLSWDEKQEIIAQIIDYHVSQPVSGIVLCYGCHAIVHDKRDPAPGFEYASISS